MRLTGTPAAGEDLTRIAGRGTIYLTVAKAYFVLSGLAIYLGLPRLLNARDFGLYSVSVGVASLLNAVIVTGTMQTVSRFVSRDPAHARAIRNKALQLQLFVGGGLTLTIVLLAPAIAGGLNDPSLTNYLRLTSLVTFCYSFYAVFLGILNGQRAFPKQAAVDISYSTLKAAFVLGLASLAYTVAGALTGWLVASMCALLISTLVVRVEPDSEPPAAPRFVDLLRFQSPVLLLILVTNLLQRADLLLVKALSSPNPATASEMAGYYSAVMNVAGVTFQSIAAIPLVAFPLIAASTVKRDDAATRASVSQTLRYSLLIMAPLAVIFSSNAGGILDFAYRPEYQAGKEALQVAPAGMLLLGLFMVLTTIISGSGKPGISATIGLIALTADIALNALLIPRFGLAGAAAGTTLAMFVGVAAASGYVWRRFRAPYSVSFVVNVFLASTAAYVLPGLLPATKMFLIPGMVLQGICYFGILFALREISIEELRSLKRIVSRP